MHFQTKIKLKKQSENLIDYQSKLVLLGSCFSENIGERFEYFKFRNTVNPFGILFHPIAIKNLIKHAIENKVYNETDVFFYNEQWHSFDAHSKLSNSDKSVLANNLNNIIEDTANTLTNSTHIIITLGTAWVYKNILDNKTVANCHKLPQKQFNKKLLSVNEILESLQNSINYIRIKNSKASIIFTVSPIRHIKDGFVENNQSKSHLITAIHRLISENPKTELKYFPAYEIMMDELRDYRFYKQDMLHPNNTAVQYIWERFNEVWMSSEVKKTMKNIDLIQKGLLHKPFNPNSQAHQNFIKTLENRIKEVKKQFPIIDF